MSLRLMRKIMTTAILFLLGQSLNASAGDTLYVGGMITKASYIQSTAGYYTVRISADGSLVILRNDGSIRYRTPAGGDFAVMQGDGNFVQYKNPGIALWATNTVNWLANSVQIFDDGDLVVFTPGASRHKIWNLGSDYIFGDPTKVGDVLGRDIAYTGLGFLGHVGIWDGQQIFQAELPTSGSNAIQIVGLFDFKHTRTQTGSYAPYWGTVNYYIPSGTISMTGCWDPVCPVYGSTVEADARYSIARRAMQVYRIGADYTLSANYTRARSTWGSVPSTRGVYRCDTFVIDMLTQSTFFYQNITPAQRIWINRWNDLNNTWGTSAITPNIVYNKLKSYQ